MNRWLAHLFAYFAAAVAATSATAATSSAKSGSPRSTDNSEAKCLPDLGFTVDPYLPPKVVRTFCNSFTSGTVGGMGKRFYAGGRYDKSLPAIYLQGEYLSSESRFYLDDCITGFLTVLACECSTTVNHIQTFLLKIVGDNGHGGTVEYKGIRYMLFPYIWHC